MSEPTLAGILENLNQTQQAFLGFLNQAKADILYRHPADEDWTPAIVLVHIAEARQFYTGEVQKVLATPGVPMGRTVEHPARLQNIENHGQDPIDDIRRRLITSHENLVKVLSQMSDEDLQIKGEHVVSGPQTLGAFIQRFLVEHDHIHVEQVKALLAGE